MPISPSLAQRYPPDWREIGVRIRARAGNRCEHCNLQDRIFGWRDDDGTFVETGPDAPVPDGRRRVWIVLTVAHLHDPSPENCDDDNLGLLCQRCHNTLDAAMRGRHAVRRRGGGRFHRPRDGRR
mgnify:CR=1 FL=1